MDLSVGEPISVVRKREGLQQQELAELAGISYSYLSLIENGHRDPTLETIRRIFAAMGYDATVTIRPRGRERD